MSTANTGFWQKALIYLGLWEEPESAQYDDIAATETGRQRAVEPEAAPQPSGPSNVRPLRLASSPDERQGPRATVVEVTGFDDCERIGLDYRQGLPVLFDLAGVDKATARRVVDFVSGMTLVAHGDLTKVASRAFLLTPEGVQVAPDERLRLEARGYRFADGA